MSCTNRPGGRHGALAALALLVLTAPAPAEDPALAKAMELKARRGETVPLDRVVASLRDLSSTPTVPAPTRLLAELEELDLLLRMGRLHNLARRLRELGEAWRDAPSVSVRTQALERVMRARQSLLIEPNAVGRVDVGERFARRYLRRPDGTIREIPRGFPIRFLSGLAEGILAPTEPDARVATVIAFVEARHLADPQLDIAGRIAGLLSGDHGDIVLGLFVYESADGPAVTLPPGDEPWTRAVVLWFAGSFDRFDGLDRRTRVEWLPGPSFFLVEFGGSVISWCLPWDRWDGFLADIDRSR